jgi:hypothetical protein
MRCSFSNCLFKKILIILLFLNIISCSDPYANTIREFKKEFKKSQHPAVLQVLKCGGEDGTLDYSIYMQGDYNKDKQIWEHTRLIKVVVKKPKINNVFVEFYFKYNEETNFLQYDTHTLVGKPRAGYGLQDYCPNIFY